MSPVDSWRLLCALSSAAAGQGGAAGSTPLGGGAEPAAAEGAEPEAPVFLSVSYRRGPGLA